jgi:hypothetical protein
MYVESINLIQHCQVLSCALHSIHQSLMQDCNACATHRQPLLYYTRLKIGTSAHTGMNLKTDFLPQGTPSNAADPA